MKRFFLLTVLVFFFAAGCAGNKEVKEQFLPGAEPASENEWRGPAEIPYDVQDKIIQEISELPEYKEAQKNIAAVSNNRKGVTAIIDRDEQGRGYTVQVGYNGGERFETYYFFLVAPRTYKISILDMTDDKYITLDAWRKKSAKK